jgi:hypothetical protein
VSTGLAGADPQKAVSSKKSVLTLDHNGIPTRRKTALDRAHENLKKSPGSKRDCDYKGNDGSLRGAHAAAFLRVAPLFFMYGSGFRL